MHGNEERKYRDQKEAKQSSASKEIRKYQKKEQRSYDKERKSHIIALKNLLIKANKLRRLYLI